MSVSTSTSKPAFFSSIINNSWVKSIWSDFSVVDPNKIKERNLLLQIEAAKSHGKLSEGVTEAWITALKRKGKLLIAEKGVLFPEKNGKNFENTLQMGFSKNAFISVEKVIDDTVSKVLEGGGEIEFVENGFLNNYKHMVMIQQD
jgi:hypothetical protein